MSAIMGSKVKGLSKYLATEEMIRAFLDLPEKHNENAPAVAEETLKRLGNELEVITDA
jgi:hypothetical protein